VGDNCFTWVLGVLCGGDLDCYQGHEVKTTAWVILGLLVAAALWAFAMAFVLALAQ
jgi:hypothetical protein